MCQRLSYTYRHFAMKSGPVFSKNSILSNLLAWALVFLSLIHGIKSSGKVVYFTATFPYIVLIALFIFGILQDGAIDGIRWYMTPDWSQLKDSGV